MQTERISGETAARVMSRTLHHHTALHCCSDGVLADLGLRQLRLYRLPTQKMLSSVVCKLLWPAVRGVVALPVPP